MTKTRPETKHANPKLLMEESSHQGYKIVAEQATTGEEEGSNKAGVQV